MDYHISFRLNDYILDLIKNKLKYALDESCVIKRCVNHKQEIVLEIDALNRNICDLLWGDRKELAHIVADIGLAHKINIKIRGMLFGSFPPQLSDGFCNSMIVPIKQVFRYTYQDLLDRVAGSKYPAFVTELPLGWHWGQPLPCILASSQVTKFSGRVAPRWHGDDVTQLYDRKDFENQYETLIKAFYGRSNKDEPYVLVPSVEYRSYTVDPLCASLSRDTLCEYQSDFEVIWLEDVKMLVRICYCKHKRQI